MHLTVMKKYMLLILFCIVSMQVTIAQKKDVRTVSIADNKIQITVPSSFANPVEVPIIVQDSLPKPEQGMFLSKDNSLIRLEYEFPSDSTALIIMDNDIPMWTDKQLSALKKSSGFTYIDDGIFLQDGKNIGYIKYEVHGEKGMKIYSMLFFISLENRLVQFNFVSPLRKRKKWEPIADAIANSLRIK
jgi:hypothetical protein